MQNSQVTKTRKSFSTVLFFFLTIGIGGCEDKEPQYRIYENHEIAACGVTNPLQNLNWLAEFTANDKESATMQLYHNYNIIIKLYRNNETEEENIVISFSLNLNKGGDKSKSESINPYSLMQVYSCSGQRLLVDSAGITNSDEWNDFFHSEKHKPQGVIWQRTKIN